MPKQYNQATQTSQSSTAATAATTAFNKNTSYGGLSSAAAAAALRTHPSPMPQLGDIQTKRLQRRGSNGSDVSRFSVATIGHTQNIASPSVSSLTNRTMRSPSPGGRRTPVDRQYKIPPIPAIPDTLITSNARRPRATSVDAVNRTPSVASRKITNRRGASMDFSEEKLDRLKQATMDREPARPTLPSVHETSSERTKRLINFSRPMSPQNSPQSKSSVQRSQNTPESLQSAHARYGQPLSHHNNIRLHVGSDFDVKPEQIEHKATSSALSKNRDSEKLQRLLGSTTGSMKRETTERKPTVVRTNSLETSKWSDTNAPVAHSQPLPSQGFATDQRLGPILASESFNASSNGYIIDPVTNQISTSDTIRQASQTPRAMSPVIPDITKSRDSVSTQKLSTPPRALHFDVTSSELRHQPLGRSASPAKSALKSSQSGSSRRNSVTTTAQSRFAELPVASESPQRSRKKSVRINLEVVPGEEAAGLVTSKHAPTYPSKSAATKPSTSFEEDLDGLMRPRPALPSFGSVRRNSRENVTSIPSHEQIARQGRPTSGLHRISQHGNPGHDTHRDEDHPSKLVERENKDEEDDEAELLDSEDEDIAKQIPSPSEKFMAASEALRKVHREPILMNKVVDADSNNTATMHQYAQTLARPSAHQQDPYVVPGSFPEAEERKHESPPTPAQTPLQTSVPAIVVVPTTPPVTDVAAVAEDDSYIDSSDDDSVYEDASEELENYEFASLDQILEEPSPEIEEAPSKHVIGKVKSPLLRQESGDTLALERRLEEARLNSDGHAKTQVTSTTPAIPPPAHDKDYAELRTPESSVQYNDAEVSSSLASSKWNPVNNARQSGESFDRSVQNITPGPTNMGRGRPSKQGSSTQAPVMIRQRSADSVSSFRKSKPPTRRDVGHSLRQSMRSSSASGVSETRGRTQRRPMTPDNSSAYNLRASMRSGMSPSSITSRTKPTWRERLTSPSGFSNKMRQPKEKKEKQSKPKFGRRFSNTSVAESTSSFTPQGFISRFADDSDDEEFTPPRRNQVIPLAPVRDVLRTSGKVDGESTDVDDSDNEDGPRAVPHAASQKISPATATPPSKPTDTATGTQGLASSRFAPVRPGAQKRWSSFLGGTKKHKLTQQANLSTPTLINPPMEDSSNRVKGGKLRRKTQRQTSQPLGAPMGWSGGNAIAGDSTPIGAVNDLVPMNGAKDKDMGFNFTDHGDDGLAASLGNFEKHAPTDPGQPNNGTTPNGVDTNTQQKVRKEDNSRFGKFKRMFSKKQKRPESAGQDGLASAA